MTGKRIGRKKLILRIPEKEWEDLESRTYHIGKEAVAVCNRLKLDPSETILWQARELRWRRENADLIREIRDIVRNAVQIEGVVLNKDQKEFFKDLFMAVAGELKK